jgi:hypothetical protein
MTGAVEDLLVKSAALLRQLKTGSMPFPTAGFLATEHCLPAGVAGRSIEKDKSYFTVRINELFLHSGREWFTTYDPVVIVTVEFVYGKSKVTIPKVVGPGLISRKEAEVPQGVLLNDILVAGPHPFKGGQIGINIVLYRVKKQDYAKALVAFIESVSAVVGAPADMAALAKIGGTLLDGVEALLNMSDSVPLAGQRIEIDGATTRGLSSSFGILANTLALDLSTLRVQDGRLKVVQSGKTRRLDQVDYVLYSIGCQDRRAEEATLPFFQLLEEARQAASTPDDKSWMRAKATLLSLYQQMIKSPDLIEGEVDELMGKFKAELVTKHARALDISTMPVDRSRHPKSALDRRLDAAVDVLAL